jgi:hypothetical protein
MRKLSGNTLRGAWILPAGLLLAGTLILPPSSFAARPLITDDAWTVGKGKVQAELGAEVSSWQDTVEGVRAKETGTEVSGVFTYGAWETIDIVGGFPYAWSKSREFGETIADENGFSDISLEVKWRFFEKNGFAFALKPGMTFPSGNDEKGFGTGKATYGATFIASKELTPFAFHFNGGYTRNENTLDEAKDLWSASFAATYEVVKGLNLVGDIGFERNADPTAETNPGFALVGFNYAVNDHVTLDAGFKWGLNKEEVDHAVTAGVTLNF